MAADHPLRRLECRVSGFEDATHDIRIVRLETLRGGPLGFSAGQYASVRFADMPARDYSMANRPDEPALELHIRRMNEAGASFHVARALRLGEPVVVEGPYGDAWLRLDHPGAILAIAGGSGLAPIKSIVDTALAAGVERPIHLYFGAREERDIYLEGHFAHAAARHPDLRFEPILTDPAGPTRRRVGRLTDAVAADHSSFAGMKAYLAGPPAMVEAAAEMLRARGLPAADIHADPFYTDAEKAARNAASE